MGYVPKYAGLTVSIAVLLTLAIIYGQKQAEDQLIFNESDFQFHVYCPISDQSQLKAYMNLIKDEDKSKIGSSSDIDTYVVYAQAKNITFGPGNVSLSMTYCGLAREWLGSCRDAQIICSSPGPMFYLPIKKPIYVIWINAMNSTDLEWPEEDCYSPDSSDMSCSIDARLTASKDKSGCTFLDPTNLNYKDKLVRISTENIPMSPHIHGISARPVYDGNPMSWFNSAGDRGVGFFSLSNPDYFKQFQQVDSFGKVPSDLLKKNIKIIRIENDQPPGNLFYHDHGMRSTRFNVKHGLAGLYFLYDKDIEKTLPQGNYQKFIIFSAYQSPILLNDLEIKAETKQKHQIVQNTGHKTKHNKKTCKINEKGECLQDGEIIYTLDSENPFQRDQTYRFRVLNNHYDNTYRNVSFAVYYRQIITYTGRIIIQIDPTTPGCNYIYNLVDLSKYRSLVKFTAIGADSCLFSKPILNMTRFDLGTAERMDVLANFNQKNGIPAEVNHFYMISFDYNLGDYVIKSSFSLQKNKNTGAKNIIDSSATLKAINVPYTNLSLVQDGQIAVKRMRALMSRPNDAMFLINGHYMYTEGASDRPQIGTIQDWYIINGLFQAHPFHVHLINFQVVKKYTLKISPDGCPFYQLDFYKQSGYAPFQSMTNQQLCLFLTNNITTDQAEDLYHYISQHYLQNATSIDSQLGKISGKNVMQKIKNPNDYAIYNGSSYDPSSPLCPYNSIYKYICGQATNSIPQYYRRWKDTALIESYTVSVLRIRWAKTQYDPKVQLYPYFNIPQQHLMEFPGFVYHCHILKHEDNEMMRPFMLQPSDNYVQSASRILLKGSNSKNGDSKKEVNWASLSKKINDKFKCSKLKQSQMSNNMNHGKPSK